MIEIIDQTKAQWAEFTPRQKAVAVAANMLTVSRPILAGMAAAPGLDRSHEWSTRDAATLGVAFATDMEGTVARLGGGETAIGGALDPITDKIASAIPEIVMAYRGEESYSNIAMKLARDIGVSAVRRHVLRQANGEVSISAGWPGKINTAARQSVNVFAMSPLGDKYPKTRRTLQIASALGTVATGVTTGRKLMNQLKKERH